MDCHTSRGIRNMGKKKTNKFPLSCSLPRDRREQHADRLLTNWLVCWASLDSRLRGARPNISSEHGRQRLL
eukprot:2127335-Pyramimonas_sp.AAC.1